VIARVRPHVPAALGAAAGMAVMWWIGLIGFAWTDYDLEASPAFKALADGHFGGFLELCPAYAGSMLLRAPFALLPGLWGGGELAVYRAVSFPCLLAAAALGVWLVGRLRAHGVGRLARVTALGVLVAGPVTYEALDYTHPEEILVASLCLTAVFAARGGRAGWTGVLLGLAVAAKPWALVAVGPVLVTLQAHRLRSLGAAIGAAAAVLSPFAFVGLSTIRGIGGGVSHTGSIFQPWQVWWWLGTHGPRVIGTDGHVKIGYRAAPEWIDRVSHPLIVVAAFALTALWLRRRRRRLVGDELLLLSLVLQVRCLVDPWNHIYYAVPCVFALVAWETLSARRAPVGALLLSVAAWVSFETLPGRVTPDVLSAVYLAWAVPFTAALAARVYGIRLPAFGPARTNSSNTRPERGYALPSLRPTADQ
jgi:hypothetical protein